MKVPETTIEYVDRVERVTIEVPGPVEYRDRIVELPVVKYIDRFFERVVMAPVIEYRDRFFEKIVEVPVVKEQQPDIRQFMIEFIKKEMTRWRIAQAFAPPSKLALDQDAKIKHLKDTVASVVAENKEYKTLVELL